MPVRPGSPAKQDSGYRRGGMANLFMAFGPPPEVWRGAVTWR